MGGAGTPLTLLAGTRAAQAASGPKRHHLAPAPATAADEHCSTRARLARYLSSRARLRSPPGWHGRAHASGLLPWMEAPASPTRAVWKKLGSWAEAPARRERKKKAPACASAGAPHSAAAHSSSQQAPGPSLGRLLFPPPPSPHRFDSISCSRVWLVSQALRHHYLRALLLPPPPPSCSPSCFIFIFHLPSAVSPLVLLQHLLPRQGTCESKRPFSIPSLRPRSASSSSPR